MNAGIHEVYWNKMYCVYNAKFVLFVSFFLQNRTPDRMWDERIKFAVTTSLRTTKHRCSRFQRTLTGHFTRYTLLLCDVQETGWLLTVVIWHFSQTFYLNLKVPQWNTDLFSSINEIQSKLHFGSEGKLVLCNHVTSEGSGTVRTSSLW